MPVSRLLVHPEQAPALAPRPELLPSDHLGLASLAELDAPGNEQPSDPATFATAIGPLGPVRAARWNRQLPASAGAVPDDATLAPGSSPNAPATSS
jgi:hypothetical protein